MDAQRHSGQLSLREKAVCVFAGCCILAMPFAGKISIAHLPVSLSDLGLLLAFLLLLPSWRRVGFVNAAWYSLVPLIPFLGCVALSACCAEKAFPALKELVQIGFYCVAGGITFSHLAKLGLWKRLLPVFLSGGVALGSLAALLPFFSLPFDPSRVFGPPAMGLACLAELVFLLRALKPGKGLPQPARPLPKSLSCKERDLWAPPSLVGKGVGGLGPKNLTQIPFEESSPLLDPSGENSLHAGVENSFSNGPANGIEIPAPDDFVPPTIRDTSGTWRSARRALTCFGFLILAALLVRVHVPEPVDTSDGTPKKSPTLIPQRYLEGYAALSVLADYPLFGLGPGEYQDRIGAYYQGMPKENTLALGTRIGYAVLLASGGIFCLASFLYWTWILWDRSSESKRRSGFRGFLLVFWTIGFLTPLLVGPVLLPLLVFQGCLYGEDSHE